MLDFNGTKIVLSFNNPNEESANFVVNFDDYIEEFIEDGYDLEDPADYYEPLILWNIDTIIEDLESYICDEYEGEVVVAIKCSHEGVKGSIIEAFEEFVGVQSDFNLVSLEVRTH